MTLHGLNLLTMNSEIGTLIFPKRQSQFFDSLTAYSILFLPPLICHFSDLLPPFPHQPPQTGQIPYGNLRLNRQQEHTHTLIKEQYAN